MNDVEKINCEKAIRHLLEYLDQEVTGDLKVQMEQHMSCCRSCFSRLEFEKTLKSHIRESSQEDAPESLHNRVTSLLKAFDK